MKFIITMLTALVIGTAAQAQEVGDCDWRSSARNLVEPWQDNTRQFSNDKVRIAVLDTIEPGVAAVHLLIISPPYDELGSPQCRVVSMNERFGFAGMTLKGMVSDYDPAKGLTFKIPVKNFIPDTGGFDEGFLTVILNQATGLITATVE